MFRYGPNGGGDPKDVFAVANTGGAANLYLPRVNASTIDDESGTPVYTGGGGVQIVPGTKGPITRNPEAK